MSFGLFRPPAPVNEPVRSYAPGSPERAQLKAAYNGLVGQSFDIPLWVGGKQGRAGNTARPVCPRADAGGARDGSFLKRVHALTPWGVGLLGLPNSAPNSATCSGVSGGRSSFSRTSDGAM